jgi:hypothetical protein
VHATLVCDSIVIFYYSYYTMLCMHGVCTLQVPGLGKISVRMEAGGAEVNVSRTDAVVVRIYYTYIVYLYINTYTDTYNSMLHSDSCASR